MKLQVLTYSDSSDPMRGEVWTAIPLVPIPVVEGRTIGMGIIPDSALLRANFVRMQAVSTTGRTKKEAVANLKELVLACINRLGNGFVEEIDF